MSAEEAGPPATPGGLVAAIVVRFADDPRLESCLEALRAQKDVHLSVIVIENASTRPAGAPPEPWETEGGAIRALRVVTRPANPGFAAAFNEAWAQVDADVVVSVNPDCRLMPDAIAAARSVLAPHQDVAAVALRLERPGRELLDSAGIVMNRLLLRARDRGIGERSAGAFQEAADVDAACLAGAVLDRRKVDRARDAAGEVLDSRYFAYQEDVDLGWRIRRAGYRVRYEPRAVGVHDRGWKERGRRQVPVFLRRLSLRNRWFTILKNITWPGLLWRLPFLLCFECALFARLLVTEPAVVPGYAAILLGIPSTLARRALARADRA